MSLTAGHDSLSWGSCTAQVCQLCMMSILSHDLMLCLCMCCTRQVVTRLLCDRGCNNGEVVQMAVFESQQAVAVTMGDESQATCCRMTLQYHWVRTHTLWFLTSQAHVLLRLLTLYARHSA
jgi:hypothetical protein